MGDVAVAKFFLAGVSDGDLRRLLHLHRNWAQLADRLRVRPFDSNWDVAEV